MTQADERNTQNAAAEGDRERIRLLRLLQEPLWFFKALREIGVLEWFVPWPLGYVHYAWQRWRRGMSFADWRTSPSRFDDNAFATATITIWCVAVLVFGARLASFEKYASDVAKILFSGAFLIGTILSVSVALPGQSLAKVTLGKSPIFAFHFVLPMVWGFVCGVAGALAMMFFPSLHNVAAGHVCADRILRGGATLLALYAAFMELNAVFHTIRQYLIGMVLWSDTIEKDSKKAQPPKDVAALPPAPAAAVTSPGERVPAKPSR